MQPYCSDIFLNFSIYTHINYSERAALAIFFQLQDRTPIA